MSASGPHPSYSGLEVPPTQAGQPQACPWPCGSCSGSSGPAALEPTVHRWAFQASARRRLDSKAVVGSVDRGSDGAEASPGWGGTLGERAGKAAARQGPRSGDPCTGAQGAAGCRGRVPKAPTSSGAEQSGWGPQGDSGLRPLRDSEKSLLLCELSEGCGRGDGAGGEQNRAPCVGTPLIPRAAESSV